MAKDNSAYLLGTKVKAEIAEWVRFVVAEVAREAELLGMASPAPPRWRYPTLGSLLARMADHDALTGPHGLNHDQREALRLLVTGTDPFDADRSPTLLLFRSNQTDEHPADITGGVLFSAGPEGGPVATGLNHHDCRDLLAAGLLYVTTGPVYFGGPPVQVPVEACLPTPLGRLTLAYWASRGGTP